MKTIWLLLLIAVSTRLNSQNVYYPPYSNDFNGYSSHLDFLQDWTLINPAGDGGYWVFDYYGFFGLGSTYAPVYLTSKYTPGDDWLISPGINLEANITYKLEFLYTALSNNSTEHLKLYMGKDKSPDQLTGLIVDFGLIFTTTNGAEFDTFMCDITPVEAGTYYFGFYAYSFPGNLGIAIENFSLSIQTGIRNEINDKDVVLYPSPVQSNLFIENVQNAIINLYGIDGVLINSYYEENQNTSIDLSTINEGIYIVKIIKGTQIIVKKIYHY